jgi:hypothetical protein
MRIYTGATPTAITCLSNAELKLTNSTRQTTCKDSGQWEEFLYGQSNWTMSGEALFSYDATNGGVAVYDIAAGQTTIAVVFQTGVTGDIKWSGTALVTEWGLSSQGQNENVTCSFSFQGTGVLTKATIA